MNPALNDLEPSLIRAVHHHKRPGDIDLGLGEPILPVDLTVFEAAMDWVRQHGCPYTANPGFPELRALIAAHYRYRYLSEPENVCVTVGSEEALYVALKTAVDPARDEVLVVEPAFPAYVKICQLEGIRCRTVDLEASTGFAPSARAVLEALRPETRAIVLCSPSNPSGRVWPAEEIEALAEGLLSRPGPRIQVLSDEVYRELYYTDGPPVSIADYYPGTWVANSLSKSHALTGLRCGFLLAPKDPMRAALKVHHLAVTAPETFAQRVMIELFQRPASFHAHRQHYQAQRTALEAALQEQGLSYVRPEGAFYCMVRLEGPLARDSVSAAFRLIDEAHVVTVPGKAFSAGAEGWMRLSWVADPPVLREGLRRFKQGMLEAASG